MESSRFSRAIAPGRRSGLSLVVTGLFVSLYFGAVDPARSSDIVKSTPSAREGKVWPGAVPFVICEATIRTKDGALVLKDGKPLSGQDARNVQIARQCPLTGDPRLASLLNDVDAAQIRAAVKIWNQTFPTIQFIEQDGKGSTPNIVAFRKTKTDPDPITGKLRGSCYTKGVGLFPQQTVKFVNIDSECTRELRGGDPGPGTSVYIILHEMMHVVGVYHEQSREDAWQYLNWDFLPAKPNQTCNKDSVEAQYEEKGKELNDYDFKSIMQYPLQSKPQGSCRMYARLFGFGDSRIAEQLIDKKKIYDYSTIGAEHTFSLDDMISIWTLYP